MSTNVREISHLILIISNMLFFLVIISKFIIKSHISYNMKIENYQNFLQEAIIQSFMVARNFEVLAEKTNKMIVVISFI